MLGVPSSCHIQSDCLFSMLCLTYIEVLVLSVPVQRFRCRVDCLYMLTIIVWPAMLHSKSKYMCASLVSAFVR